MGYNAAFANFLATATELPEPALKDAVAEHITGLKGQIDAYAAKDYPTAYANVRDAYAHMFMTGDTLAGGDRRAGSGHVRLRRGDDVGGRPAGRARPAPRRARLPRDARDAEGLLRRRRLRRHREGAR